MFCGSSTGVHPQYVDAARRFGQVIAESGRELVYGGGRVGLMGALADAALSAGGHAIGVMPRALVEKERAHTGLTRLHVVESMHERKARMADLADAFVLLPGGFGSWDEFCEVLTWAQLGIHQKPCGILNVAGYYDSLFAMMDRAVRDGFLRPVDRDMIVVDDEAERLLARVAVAPVVPGLKWEVPAAGVRDLR